MSNQNMDSYIVEVVKRQRNAALDTVAQAIAEREALTEKFRVLQETYEAKSKKEAMDRDNLAENARILQESYESRIRRDTVVREDLTSKLMAVIEAYKDLQAQHIALLKTSGFYDDNLDFDLPNDLYPTSKSTVTMNSLSYPSGPQGEGSKDGVTGP